jgi:hypothetical protein
MDELKEVTGKFPHCEEALILCDSKKPAMIAIPGANSGLY